MMGGLVGIVLALVIIICLELLNNKVRSVEDIKERTGCPVIGEVASFNGSKNKDRSSDMDRSNLLLTSGSVPFYITESYKALRTNFAFTVSASEQKNVVMTSANPNEGKSTTASNLAISLAQMGHKVLLIDADLCKPVLHRIFQIDNSGGLSTMLCGMHELKEVLHEAVVENLDVLPADVIPPNPAELLGSKKMREFLDQVNDTYAYVILDAPPINTVSDAITINGEIAGLLLVARFDRTKYDDINRAVKAVEFANLNILGFVLNDIAVKHSSGYYKSYYKNYYYKEYSHDEEGKMEENGARGGQKQRDKGVKHEVEFP
ncbi:MAG: polysaccharide biosynthesis tyrosine autokinase [Ruminococcus sp.]|nr:polysaccharide biosynthesis tyrosine autokinase [Ruminococcus sp.]